MADYSEIEELVAELEPLPQSDEYLAQAYGGEDLRGDDTSGSFYGEAEESYNAQEVEEIAQAILASGVPLQSGNKVYDTGNRAVNEALYGPDIANNIGTDGTTGFRTPRQFDTGFGDYLKSGLFTGIGLAAGGALGAGAGALGAGGALSGAIGGAGSQAVTGALSGNIDTDAILAGAVTGGLLGGYNDYSSGEGFFGNIDAGNVDVVPGSSTFVPNDLGAATGGGGDFLGSLADYGAGLTPSQQAILGVTGSAPNVSTHSQWVDPTNSDIIFNLSEQGSNALAAGGLPNMGGLLGLLGGGGNNTLQIPDGNGGTVEIPVTDPGGGLPSQEEQPPVQQDQQSSGGGGGGGGSPSDGGDDSIVGNIFGDEFPAVANQPQGGGLEGYLEAAGWDATTNSDRYGRTRDELIDLVAREGTATYGVDDIDSVRQEAQNIIASRPPTTNGMASDGGQVYQDNGEWEEFYQPTEIHDWDAIMARENQVNDPNVEDEDTWVYTRNGLLNLATGQERHLGNHAGFVLGGTYRGDGEAINVNAGIGLDQIPNQTQQPVAPTEPEESPPDVVVTPPVDDGLGDVVDDMTDLDADNTTDLETDIPDGTDGDGTNGDGTGDNGEGDGTDGTGDGNDGDGTGDGGTGNGLGGLLGNTGETDEYELFPYSNYGRSSAAQLGGMMDYVAKLRGR